MVRHFLSGFGQYSDLLWILLLLLLLIVYFSCMGGVCHENIANLFKQHCLIHDIVLRELGAAIDATHSLILVEMNQHFLHVEDVDVGVIAISMQNPWSHSSTWEQRDGADSSSLNLQLAVMVGFPPKLFIVFDDLRLVFAFWIILKLFGIGIIYKSFQYFWLLMINLSMWDKIRLPYFCVIKL